MSTRAKDSSESSSSDSPLAARVHALIAALKSVTEHMDRAGGDAYAMPECPWCHAQREGDEHNGDCELLLARAVIVDAEAALAAALAPKLEHEAIVGRLRNAIGMLRYHAREADAEDRKPVGNWYRQYADVMELAAAALAPHPARHEEP